MLVAEHDLPAVVERLLAFKEFGVDTETTGVEWRDRLFSIIIAVSAEEVYYFNFQDYPGLEPCHLLPRGAIRQLQPIFRVDCRYYVSNAKFDMRMLRHEGLRLDGNWFCINAQGRVLRNNYLGDGYGLAASAERFGFEPKVDAVEAYITEHGLFTVREIPGKAKKWKDKRFWEVPLAIIQPYAEHDARLHLLVGQKIAGEIDALVNPGGTQRPARISQNEQSLTTVCHQMEWDGAAVDLDYVRRARAFESGCVEAAQRTFKELTGGLDFIDSGKALFAAFSACGYEEIPRTEKGNPSFTDDVLADLEGPLAECVRKIRHHEKRISTYYSSFEHYADPAGVIHPNMRQGGTETGRFSYSEPNLQNIPKEETPKVSGSDPWYFPESIVRRSFVPRDPYCLVMIDYAQQEYRMMLDYAGETELIKQVMDGADVHQAMADQIGISRQYAKTLNFAILYGAGPAKIAKMLKLPIREASELLRLYNSKVPKVQAFKEQVISKGRARGYIVNWAGRRCHIARRDWAYVLPNHLVQGGCADTIKTAMVLIYGMLASTKSRMILTVHDEILLEMHPDDFELIPSVQRVMESVYPSFNGMKLTTTVDHSWKSWGHIDKQKGLPNAPAL